MTLICACTHTHGSAGTCVCAAFPALPLPWWAGWAGATSPQGNKLLKDLIWHFHIQLTACNIPLKKYIICLLAWSVTKIIFTSVTLTVSGQEAERLCRPRCLPAPPGCLPENRAAVPEERVRSPGLRLTLLAVPLVTTEEVNGTGDLACTALHLCYWRTQQKLQLPKSGERVLFFSLENLIPRSLVFPLLLYHCWPPNSYTTTLFQHLPKHSYLFSTLWLHVHVGWKSFKESYLNTASSSRYCLGNELCRAKQH